MKKRNLLLTLACSTLLLTSCDKIVAKLPNGDNPLTNAINIPHNTLNQIYEAIKGGDSYASNVSSILTQELANAVLGKYKVEFDDKNADKYSIILVGYDDVTDEAKKTEFIKSHKAYYDWDKSAYRLTLKETEPSKENFEKRIEMIKKIIDKQIVSTLWTEANASAYKRNNRFYEVLYARQLSEKLFTIKDANNKDVPVGENDSPLEKNPTYIKHYNNVDNKFNGFKEVKAGTADALTDGFTDGVLIDSTYEVESEEGRNNIKKVLHINYYIDYINASIMPTIMKNLLVEQYVLQEQYNAIGNTSSRKVNYIQVANNEAKNGDLFFNKFVKDYFTGKEQGKVSLSTNEKYAIASDAWKGDPAIISTSTAATELADATFGKPTDENPSKGLDGHDERGNYIQDYQDQRKLTYYKNTPYADIIEDYSTLSNDISVNNSTNYSAFTSIDSISYEPIVGLSIKKDGNTVADYTTYGWQTKDTTSLPDAIKNKLYSYGFINDWKGANASGEDSYNGSYLYEVGKDQFFLVKDVFSNLEESLLWEEGGSYYLVQVEDVISPDTATIHSESTDVEKLGTEEKVREVAYTLASGTTYTTNALTYYLEQCNINYHDQDVYDYFKTNFPKLFE